ncbi:MAG: HEAT repeat domain-containing protein [Syntrophothermus sp.]
MKKYILVFSLFSFFFLTVAGYSYSTSTPKSDKKVLSSIAIQNLIKGVNSNNLGLKVSAAYILGEYGCDEAVIPLMRMFRNDENEDARIMAAISLYKLNDGRGVQALQKAYLFETSARVKKICKSLCFACLKDTEVASLR